MAKLTSRQWAALVRNAKNAQPVLSKVETINRKMAALYEEREQLLKEIEAYQSIVTAMTGGYRIEDVVRRVVEKTGKTNSEGYDQTVTKYVPTSLVHLQEDGTYLIEDIILEGSDFNAEANFKAVEEVEEVESIPNQAPFNPIEHE